MADNQTEDNRYIPDIFGYPMTQEHMYIAYGIGALLLIFIIYYFFFSSSSSFIGTTSPPSAGNYVITTGVGTLGSTSNFAGNGRPGPKLVSRYKGIPNGPMLTKSRQGFVGNGKTLSQLTRYN